MRNLAQRIALLTACVLASAVAQTRAETPEQRDARMQWFRDARFGMFIHWGLYAQAAGQWNGKESTGTGEWIMNDVKIPVADYEKLVTQFNPVKFDAKEWVRIAKAAGMKYIVITSKHHDGFCLFDSKVSDYDIMATPFKRDIMKELAEACHAEGIEICWYHSIMDWHHADAQEPHYPTYNTAQKKNPNFTRYVETYLKPQIKELLTNYGKVGIVWFDGEWIPEWTEEMGQDMYAYCRSLQPGVIVNNRVGKGRAGMAGMSKDKSAAGDYGTPEQEIPATGFPGIDWESCMTMNDTWGFKKSDKNWKSAAALIHNLIDCASKGGNFLLNVGPTGEGLIPQASVDRLAEVGRWMKINRESIYGTTASPFPKLPWGRCTQKPGKLYLHVYLWPADGKLFVPMSNKIKNVYLLAGNDKSPTATPSGNGQIINLPMAAPDKTASVAVAEIDGEPHFVPLAINQIDDGSLNLLAYDADVVGTRAKLEKKGANPYNIGYWTNVGDIVQWQARIDKPGKFEVVLSYSCDPTSAGSEYDLEFGDQKIHSTIVGTTSFLDFHSISLGTLEISKTGSITVTVRPTKKPKLAVMDLRSITLTPVH
jgi:alpha-L-fucosidase